MNLLDVKQIVGKKLPARLVSLIEYLGIEVSVHPPDERHADAVVAGGAVAYIYATDRPGADPPWRQTEAGGLEAGDIIGAKIKQDAVIALVDSLCLSFIRAYKLAKEEAATAREMLGENTHMLRVFLPGGRITVTVPYSIGQAIIADWRKIRRGDSRGKDIILSAETDDDNKVVVHGPDVAGMMLTEMSRDAVEEISELPILGAPGSSEAP